MTPFVLSLIFMDKDACNYVVRAMSHRPMLVERILSVYRVWVVDVQHLLATGSKEEIKNFAQRPGFNSLYQIDCGGKPYRIFSMIHTKGLHAIEVGLCKYMMGILFEELPK
jgi:hypothetical protein